MDKEYKTIENAAEAEFVEKRSRFICYCQPVKTQAQAVDFINKIKSKHRDATHNVPAYVLRENNIQHSSDDGEPSGTAGVPVLDVMLKEGIVDACVVITRYFGGTLLGTGGLVRAYSHGSKLALEAGGIITMAPCKLMSVSVDYSFYERLMIILKNSKAVVDTSDFSHNVSVSFAVREKDAQALENTLIEQSNGKYKPEIIGEKFSKIE